MASKGRKKASIHSLSRERWTPGDQVNIARELGQGSDRASAIVGATVVEAMLVHAIYTHFQEMDKEDHERLFFDQTAPLGTFSAKIKIGYAIGIYGLKVRNQLDIIRRIRNVFAHSARPLQFDHPLIEDELSKLRNIDLSEVSMPRAHVTISPSRAKFLANCFDLQLALERYAINRFDTEITIGFSDWPDDERAPLLHKSM